MRATIFGIQPVDFVSSDGNQIIGKNLYVGFDNKYVDGQKTAKYFINKNTDGYSMIEAGMDVTIDFNDKGKIESITL